MINRYLSCAIISSIMTYKPSFYHGKIYYISNGHITYVILGSSNVTISAYKKNRELDMILRFDEDNRVPDKLLHDVRDWIDQLKSESTEITQLDETLFDSTLYEDETRVAKHASFFKTLTSAEEKDRYIFLESLKPSSIKENLFVPKKDFKAFGGYIAFIYAEYGITIIESFVYGNSCYVFATTDMERLQRVLFRKSKEQIKNSVIYITDIQHDELYQDTIWGVLNANHPTA